jgi:hypothetical protein
MPRRIWKRGLALIIPVIAANAGLIITAPTAAAMDTRAWRARRSHWSIKNESRLAAPPCRSCQNCRLQLIGKAGTRSLTTKQVMTGGTARGRLAAGSAV